MGETVQKRLGQRLNLVVIQYVGQYTQRANSICSQTPEPEGFGTLLPSLTKFYMLHLRGGGKMGYAKLNSTTTMNWNLNNFRINTCIRSNWNSTPGRGTHLHTSCWGRTHFPFWGAQEQPGRCCPQPAERIEVKAPALGSLYCRSQKRAMYILEKVEDS